MVAGRDLINTQSKTISEFFKKIYSSFACVWCWPYPIPWKFIFVFSDSSLFISNNDDLFYALTKKITVYPKTTCHIPKEIFPNLATQLLYGGGDFR